MNIKVKQIKINQKYEKYIFTVILLAVIFVLLFNLFTYNPLLGYDADDHLQYIDHLSRYLPRALDLPSNTDTREFFNPPGGYLFSSLAQVICRNIVTSEDLFTTCKPIYIKSTQIFQSILYLLTIFWSLKALKIINETSKLTNLSFLLMFSILGANYRTISMIRGEPYILFFLSLTLFKFAKLSSKKFEFNNFDIATFGFLIGALALSRQWAFLLFPGFLLLYFINAKIDKKRYFKFISLSFLIGFGSSSWFYFSLFFRYGSFTAFNNTPVKFSFYNQPLEFYVPTLENLRYLFYKPIRPYLDNQFISILYSDLWGDYWGYFTFTSRYLNIGRNQDIIGDYLARVNLISIIPSILIILFFLKGRNFQKFNEVHKYLSYSVLFSVFGYLWFTIKYPMPPTGDTIKTTYIIQLFYLLVFGASIYLEKLKTISSHKYFLVVTIFLITFIHNFYSYLSHFPYSFIKSL